MWKHLIVAGWLAAMLAPSAQAQSLRDNPKCVDNPLFSRFPGEKLSVCERLRFASLELWLWKQAGDPKSGTEPTKVEGEYWNYLSEIERDALGRHPSTLEVKRNFENAVRAAGGTIAGSDGSTVSYRIVRADGEYWGRSGCGRGGDECAALMHRIVRKAALTQSVGVLGATATAANTAVASAAPASAPGAAACQCGCVQACQASPVRPQFGPGLFRPDRPGTGRIEWRVPTEPAIYPPKGMRGMVVHIIGPRVDEVTEVLFGETPAPILARAGQRLTVQVPVVASEAHLVHLELPDGGMTVRPRFEVYQLPDTSPSSRASPCPVPLGDMRATVSTLNPLRVLPGQSLTVTAPGIAALSDEITPPVLSGQDEPRLLGLAFSHDATVTTNAVGWPQVPETPIVNLGRVRSDTFTVTVPPLALTGPVALVVYTSDFMGREVLQCLSSGPGLSIGPPPPKKPRRGPTLPHGPQMGR